MLLFKNDYPGPGRDDAGSKIGAAWRMDRMAYYVSVSQQIGAHGLHPGAAHAGDGKGPGATAKGSALGLRHNFCRAAASQTFPVVHALSQSVTDWEHAGPA